MDCMGRSDETTSRSGPQPLLSDPVCAFPPRVHADVSSQGQGDGSHVCETLCQLGPRWLCEPRSDCSVPGTSPAPTTGLPLGFCKKNSTTLFVKLLRNCSTLVMTEWISWTHTQGISYLLRAAGHHFHVGHTHDEKSGDLSLVSAVHFFSSLPKLVDRNAWLSLRFTSASPEPRAGSFLSGPKMKLICDDLLFSVLLTNIQ